MKKSIFLLCFVSFFFTVSVKGINLKSNDNAFLVKKKKSTKKVRKIKSFYKASLSFGYDDNIIQLSPRDISRFDSGDIQYSTHFSIKSTEDFIFKPDITCETVKKKQSFVVGYKGNFYTKNSVKNYSSFSLEYIQKLNKKHIIGFKYSLIPSFYIRNLADIDDLDANGTAIYHQAKIKINSISFSLTKKLKNKAFLDFSLQYALKDFNKNFNERDTKALGTEINLEKNFKKSKKLNFNFSFTNNKAKAQGENPNSIIPYPDTSNYEMETKISFSGKQKSKIFYKISLGYASKNFTTDLTSNQDPFHSGRKDKSTEFQLYLNKKFNKNYTLSLLYDYTKKTSNADSTVTDEVTAYTENKIFFGLIYKY